jgi:hypothetical protein
VPQEIGNGFFARIYILGCLTDIMVKNTFTKGPRITLTNRRMPTPAEITFAGENIYETIKGGP